MMFPFHLSVTTITFTKYIVGSNKNRTLIPALEFLIIFPSIFILQKMVTNDPGSHDQKCDS